MIDMAKTFFFYDLETTGIQPRADRIMQFAGQRTDENLELIGEPVNVLVELTDDILPSPDALMVTGITPQKTRDEGMSEADFARLATDEIFTPDTVTIGFNNIRFDDEFMRATLWRNFHDPYEWSWKDGRSRWDLLDVVRMTRALRPDGINWPVVDGKATNRLELLSSENNLEHAHAHDALSDVIALIEVTKLIRKHQPQLYEYLYKMRSKTEVKKLVNLDDKKPFVYTSGRYDAQWNKTTVAFPLTAGRNGNVIVYDLRHDPTQFVDLSEKDLSKKLFASWDERRAEDFVALPVKELQYNRAPAVAPLGVLEQQDGWKAIGLDSKTVEAHKKTLLAHAEFAEKVRGLYENRPEYPRASEPEQQLYDGFLNDRDRIRVEAVRNASDRELADFHPEFDDERLTPLLLHYKARNYPRTLSESEVTEWENWRRKSLHAQLPSFTKALQRLSAQSLGDEKTFVLQELQLWAEAILPADD